MSFALDTNTLIYFFRGEGQVAACLWEVPPGAVGIPAVVLYELRTGIAKSSAPQKRARQLGALLRHVQVLPFGIEEAQAAAKIRARLEAEGRPIGPMDTLIAGTAVATGATLITRNLKEFGRVPGLAVADWYGPA